MMKYKILYSLSAKYLQIQNGDEMRLQSIKQNHKSILTQRESKTNEEERKE